MKRSTPLKRTHFKTKASTEGLTQPRATIKTRKCKVCRTPFFPRSITHKACSPECAEILGKQEAAKQAARVAVEERKQTRAQLEAMKTVPELKKEAQAAFNRYVRLRDAGRNCISCNTPPPDLSGLHAGRDAGHYRSTGAADHLRFHEDNCHAQCVSCNQYKAGNVVAYRAGLVWRIGPERLAELESNNAPMKWTRSGLREIRDTYRAKARELEKQLREAKEMEPA